MNLARRLMSKQATGPWTPAQITLAWWLKEQGTISSWTDHSGNNRHFTQAVADNQPNISNTLNGLTVRTFVTEDFMDMAETITWTAQCTFAVFLHSSSATYTRIATQSDAGDDYNNTGHYIPIVRAALNNQFGALANGDNRSTISVPQNAYCIFASVHTGSVLQNFINGVGGATYSHTLNKQFTRYRIGRSWGAAAGPLTGRIAELICLSFAPSADVRQKIEGYLAHRWALTAGLASDHPYKTIAP